jgi:hypothetical protein
MKSASKKSSVDAAWCAFFNDFWSGTHDKPAAFAERLDQAEDYLNERLTANGEVWRLDAKTRIMLGLPPRSS